MGEHQWQRRRTCTALMNKVDIDTIDLRTKMRQAIELRLDGCEVEAIGPARRESSQIKARHAQLPADICTLRRPLCTAHPLTQLRDGRGIESNVETSRFHRRIRAVWRVSRNHQATSV